MDHFVEPNFVLIGDELGQIKKLDLLKKQNVTINLTPCEPVHPSKSIVSISPLSSGSMNKYFLIGRKTNDLFIYDASDDHVMKVEYSVGNETTLVNCQCIDDQNVVLGFQNGSIYRINIEKALCSAQYKPNNKALHILGIENIPSQETNEPKRTKRLKTKPSKDANECVEKKSDILTIFNPNWNTEMTYLSCFKVRQEKLAVGGYNTDLKVFDIPTGKNLFSAKSNNTDWLGIKHPIWLSGLDWIGSEDSDPHLIATCSRTEPFIKIYDIKERQKKPILSVNMKNINNANNESNPPSLTTICSMPSLNNFRDSNYTTIIGTTLGRMIALDLRIKARTSKILGGFKGFSGSIRDIKYARGNKTSYKIFSCSMDRFVSIHKLDNNSRHLEQKIFVKTRPTCLHPFFLDVKEENESNVDGEIENEHADSDSEYY